MDSRFPFALGDARGPHGEGALDCRAQSVHPVAGAAQLVIDLIQQCSTVTGAGRIARITWDEAWGIMSRAVAWDQARKAVHPTPYIGVDEKAFRKGHRYHTIVQRLP